MEAMAYQMSDIQAWSNLLMTQQVTGGQALNMSLRGLSFADIEKSFDPTVAVVVDGAFIGTSSGQLLTFSTSRRSKCCADRRALCSAKHHRRRHQRAADSPGGRVHRKFELEAAATTPSRTRRIQRTAHQGLLTPRSSCSHFDGRLLKYANTGQNGGGGDNTNFGASFC